MWQPDNGRFLIGVNTLQKSLRAFPVNDADLSSLRGAHRDYSSARDVLVRLGLLPERSTARGFQPQPTRELIAEGVAIALREEWLTAKDEEPELPGYLAGLDERWRSCFLGASYHLCCHLAFANISGI
jgi:hypothetical protein